MGMVEQIRVCASATMKTTTSAVLVVLSASCHACDMWTLMLQFSLQGGHHLTSFTHRKHVSL